MCRTHPLDMPEIRSIIASKLGLKDLTSCARVQSFMFANQSSISGEIRVLSSILTNSRLATLDLRSNPIRENGAQALFEALKTNLTLTTLSLRANSIGDNGAQILAEALKNNSTLTNLDLGLNSIGDNGDQALSEALKTNSTLTTLNLDPQPNWR
ncbi:hypothetical protein EC957_004873 [Mortierella hygrophila]|uniref:RNI-like protein n=1 Tax=Mortierella hygrophila TaxID=979708 RepID=A0A9P6K0A4_9FUNG|nr:hypothetical protein EC957_004873 [Mortierella hygrophila]